MIKYSTLKLGLCRYFNSRIFCSLYSRLENISSLPERKNGTKKIILNKSMTGRYDSYIECTLGHCKSFFSHINSVFIIMPIYHSFQPIMFFKIKLNVMLSKSSCNSFCRLDTRSYASIIQKKNFLMQCLLRE